MINSVKDYEKLSEQYNKMLEERNTLIDDLSWYKANISSLERENEQLRKTLIKTQNLADELMEYQVKYINLTNHIRLKASANPGEHRYIALVNFIDRLEKGEK
ncbi:hypothetical protein BU062_12150 [Staphylococcus succinus]|uniref:hypothetical protein n=1 Tax=Staphylococcus succinus TaxID=61015 RepID=UPI000D1F245C|nr:hypothetical protein [Staphylococcus succinus]PTI39041.1 hypothetical protein BU062_12150 [Staphylococcus succinus]